jgi:DNA-binding GntR family transcriptional regulator
MIAEHHTVVDAVAAQDADAAETALRQHLRTALSSLPDIRRAHPEFFEEE